MNKGLRALKKASPQAYATIMGMDKKDLTRMADKGLKVLKQYFAGGVNVPHAAYNPIGMQAQHRSGMQNFVNAAGNLMPPSKKKDKTPKPEDMEEMAVKPPPTEIIAQNIEPKTLMTGSQPAMPFATANIPFPVAGGGMKVMKYGHGGKHEGEEAVETSANPEVLVLDSEMLRKRRPLENFLFGEREELVGEEGQTVAKVFRPSKVRQAFGAPDVKATFDHGGKHTGEETEAPAVWLHKKAMENPGVEVTGSSASPALRQGLGWTTAVDATATPMTGIHIPPGEEMPVDITPTVAPVGMAPLDPRQAGPIPIKMDRRIVPPEMSDITLPETKTGERFTWIPKQGEMGMVRPGTGYVSQTTGPQRGKQQEVIFSPESVAQYLFEQKQVKGKPKFKGYDKAGFPIMEHEMLYPTYEDAFKEADRIYKAQKKRLGEDTPEYDMSLFTGEKAHRPSGVITPR